MVTQSSSSTFRLTIYMSCLEFGTKSYRFFKLLDGRAHVQDPYYSTRATVPLPFLNLNLRRHPQIERTERVEGEEEKRREGRLEHVFVDPRRSTPKIGWGSFPLSVFPISIACSRCSWWSRLVWCSAARLDARKKLRVNGVESPWLPSSSPSPSFFPRENPR